MLQWAWEYTKRVGTLLIMNFLFGITMFLVFALDNVAARVAIVFVMLAAMFALDFFLMRSAGEQDFKMSVIGEAKRRNKPSGAPEGHSTYHISKEYRVYKGFLIGLITMALAIVLIVAAQMTGSNGVKIALVIVYGWLYFPVVAISLEANLFFCLIVFAVALALFGVSYIIGGEKGRLQHYILLKKTNAISEMEKKN